MKNKEKYLDEILELFIEHQGGRICDYKMKKILNCNSCKHTICSRCKEEIKLWLEQEHKEPIKLTDDEKVILRNVDKYFRWIARDKIGDLYLWGEKPYKKDVWWIDDWGTNFNFDIYSHLFQFIKWEDEVPYSIEELLND